jgi:multisubunit Na+/H+ antiporter MnhG subunit
VLAALLVRERLASPGLQGLAAVAIVFVASPVVTHALARTIRRTMEHESR